MENTTQPHLGYRELNRRTNGGITVSLHWRQRDDDVVIFLTDEHDHRNDFLMHVEKQSALQAFNHPFAEAPHRKVVHTEDDVPLYSH